jgi:histidinol phosphatase-like enzyme (inositol monophosphatase family)
MNESTLFDLVEFAVQVAEGAGRKILPYFRQPIEVMNKASQGSFDPVTDADRAAEDFIREQIHARFPDHGILGEERGAEGMDRNFTWVIDPIDGTRAFVLGQLHWGTLLGLTERGAPRIGVVHQPYVGETFVGSARGAELRTRSGIQQLKSRSNSRLQNAVLCATDPTMFATNEERSAFERVARSARGVRYGGDCYTPCLVAAGHADLVIEAQNKLWDILPLVPILEAAGAVVTDWSGELPGKTGQVIIAANRELHREVLNAIQS